ncbi:unnamed protein product [Lampetra planeri]
MWQRANQIVETRGVSCSPSRGAHSVAWKGRRSGGHAGMQTESDGSLDTRGARAGPGGTTRCGQERPGLIERRERSPRGALRVACQCREASGAHRERDPLQAGGGGGMVEDTDVAMEAAIIVMNNRKVLITIQKGKVEIHPPNNGPLRVHLSVEIVSFALMHHCQRSIKTRACRRSDGEAAVTQKEIAVEPSAWSKEAAVERATFGGGTRGPTRPR